MPRLSAQAEREFMEGHIPKVWDLLHNRFGFNLKYWKPKFQKYLKKHAREMTEAEVFYRFGNEFIDPILNDVLGRRIGYPTFNYMVDFVVTGKKGPKDPDIRID